MVALAFIQCSAWYIYNIYMYTMVYRASWYVLVILPSCSHGQDRGAECVAVRDDVGGGRFPSSENTCYLTDADHPKNFVSGTNTPKTCDTVSRDTHCVCKKPDNPARLGIMSMAVAGTCRAGRVPHDILHWVYL